ncbi:hypothetical protein A9Q99_00325 [Gammaproteobacteria bacterium 45_16_T64]|nr:hypothetical protein A9Q99_00325 [Gammaproteobacteria bacterium 45_16_T64]
MKNKSAESCITPFFILALFCIHPAYGKEVSISICSDSNFWFPYTFEIEGESKGLHVDIVNAATNRIDVKATMEPLPWKRCLYSAEKGVYDAVISASYKDKRSKYLFYPTDASGAEKSKYRITQVGYTILSSNSDSFNFDGDFSKIPEPVRVPFGYSIAEDISKHGLLVETSTKGIRNNLRNLIKSNMGSIVTTLDMAELISSDKSKDLHVSHKPISSKSYFMAFSKKTSLTDVQRINIWKSIAAVRQDPKVMHELISIYDNYDSCLATDSLKKNQNGHAENGCD